VKPNRLKRLANLKPFTSEYQPKNRRSRKGMHYAEIDIPVVIMTGDHDEIVSAKENAYRLKSALPQAELVEVKDTGHEIPQTHPEAISRALSSIRSTIAAIVH